MRRRMQSYLVRIGFVLMGMTSVAILSAGEAEPVVMLSPYEVVASRIEFVHWIRVSSPHFVVYTDADETEATAVVRKMEMLHQAVPYFFHRKGLTRAATIVILPTTGSDWSKLANRGMVDWEPALTKFFGVRDLVVLQSDWQGDSVEALWGGIGGIETHALNLSGPLWFQQGIYYFFSSVKFGEDSLTIGKEGKQAVLPNMFGWMDWREFFTIGVRSRQFTTDPDHLKYVGQAATIMHYVLTNQDPVWRAKLLAWVAFLEAGNSPTESNFERFFGLNWSLWQYKLEESLNGGRYQSGTVHFPQSALEIPIKIDEPHGREMRELFVLSQVNCQRTKESETSLEALIDHGIKTDRLRELFADTCRRWGKIEEESRELRILILAHSENPAVYVRAANILYTRKIGGAITLDSRLDEADCREIRAWCERARELEPRLIQAGELLAWTAAFSPSLEKRTVDGVAEMIAASDDRLSSSKLLLPLAIAQWRTGDVKNARVLAEDVDKSLFSTENQRRLARELLARTEGAR